jgi:BMFP domain-containing protein YqiC
MSDDELHALRRRIAQLEDVIAAYRHSAESMRCRLAELENRVGKPSAPDGAWRMADAPPTFVAYKDQSS